ncbi:hypothetical protein GYN67_03105 [Lactococcus piscium]|uniref:DUF3592 domain-containing protein n=1 Tax=Pseudolactococcus carnosus TaxID=2749961 RepID=UPI000BD2BEA9|nr:DUF3592 domain-containing protein [Lactococcus carnosus]MCJ1979174.1 hypothetical protein [Lactococcus carnosus]MCJ1995683.1 hypothetical protein [Lactococcus carnosus]MCJ2001563.1 hypothetical protein [Lactococcus carnosus]SOB47928.1 conserved hypothetical protein [Lactococcus piscium]
MTKILQRLSRIVLAVFALILLFIGGMNCQRYLTERHDPKTAVSGQVIKSASTKLVRYQFKSITYQQVPVGNITQTFGKVGEQVTVYVNHHNPKKIYMKKNATSLLIISSVLIGWAILIGLVLFFEYWFIHRLKVMSEPTTK